jgi:hypothetical protein
VSDLPVEVVLRLADQGLYVAKGRGRNQAIGIVAPASLPAPSSHPKYRRVEELQKDGVLQEVCTLGPVAHAPMPAPELI